MFESIQKNTNTNQKIFLLFKHYIFYLTILSVTLVTQIVRNEYLLFDSGPYQFFLFVTIPYASTPPLLSLQLFLDICLFSPHFPQWPSVE